MEDSEKPESGSRVPAAIMAERPQQILQRLRKIQDQELKDALVVLNRLRDGEKVSDGDLIDAAFAFTTRTDLGNPIVGLTSYFIERFMIVAGLPETPKGLKRDWFGDEA